jgi:hypothetical protein
MERSFPYPLLSWTALFAWRVRGFSTPQVAAALVLGFLVLFLPPGLAAGLMWGSGRVVPWASVAGGTGGAAALALLLALQLGLSLPAAWMAGAALVAGAGIPLGRLDRRRSVR